MSASSTESAKSDNELLSEWNETTYDFSSLTGEELKEQWELLSQVRDDLVYEMQSRKLYPSEEMNRWEAETGAYPSQGDPEFLQKLLAKREFAESLQTSWEPKFDPCEDTETFEVTPVQRFVSNLMSPRTPYMSALLYHGVGVGKTCSAIQIAEAWLDSYPGRRVIIITPPTIKEGFERTIFDTDPKRFKIGRSEGEPNTHIGCTGNKYFELTGTLYERDEKKIVNRIKREINRRYNIMGYLAFANYIQTVLKRVSTKSKDDEKYNLAKAKAIQSEFSGSLLIVDEAHNLRDLPDEVADSEVDAPGGPVEKADAVAGKQLTPFLREVLTNSEGMKLVLMTATPMYDNYREIIFLLNLLLMNDKKALLSESKVFDSDGRVRKMGQKLLAGVASRYISFMRGENPKSFPIRLNPQNIDMLTEDSYPPQNPRGGKIDEEEIEYINHLPITPIELKGDALDVSLQFMRSLPAGTGGISSISMTAIVQAGDFVVPSSDESDYASRIGESGLSSAFTVEKTDREIRYKAKDPSWLTIDSIGNYSPKFEFLLDRLKTSEGVSFVYTRFVKGCALPLALVLEANGYTAFGRKKSLLANGIVAPGGRQCALCERKEKNHGDSDHTFTPAYYGLLTGDIELSPNNDVVIKAERNMDNVDGKMMKVIIGSQIASEGVDLRFIRETHVLDSWYHLSKTEQIVGRSIRFRSHCALPAEKRNTTVYLYASIYPDDIGRETADLYSYRIAFRKARQVGRITRILKQNAIDCNLNHDAIIITGQKTVRQIDGQKTVRETVDINDQPFTAICDWTEDCDYPCLPTIKVDIATSDDSTYDEYTSSWLLTKLKTELRNRFSEQAVFSTERMSEMIEAPTSIRNLLLLETVNNKSFQVEHGGKKGYIRYCNGYYIFQPNALADLSVPLSIRIEDFPVKRDRFVPKDVPIDEVVMPDEEEEEETELEDPTPFWLAVNKWVDLMATKREAIRLSGEIIKRIEMLAGKDKSVEKKLNQVLGMVRWFQLGFHSLEEGNVEAFKKAILEFIWDNWLKLDEQLILSGNESAVDYENRYRLGSTTIVRLLNPVDDKLLFICPGGKTCSKAVIDEVQKSKDDPLNSLVATDSTTAGTISVSDGKGSFKPLKLVYGFCGVKKGNIVFKTNTTPTVGEPVSRGAECANVSNTSDHMNKLVYLGSFMRSKGAGAMNLTREKLIEPRKDSVYGSIEVKNATRICALLELVLRYMDKQRFNGKRWFYRPVASFYMKAKKPAKI
jgi:hypothetical protein